MRSIGPPFCGDRHPRCVSALTQPAGWRALEVALSLAEPGDAAPDAHAIGLAVLDMLRRLAGRTPVVVAVDDAQWLDPATAAVLQIALRRLRAELVGALITVREAPGLTIPIELDRCFDGGRLERLVVGPLTMGASYRLLRYRVGLDLSRPEVVRLHAVTAANPDFTVDWDASSRGRTPVMPRPKWWVTGPAQRMVWHGRRAVTDSP